jgi:hypothetical protein
MPLRPLRVRLERLGLRRLWRLLLVGWLPLVVLDQNPLATAGH